MQYTIQEQIDVMLKECLKYRKHIVIGFVVTSLVLLAVGVIWPKRYKAESLIYVDNRSVIKPLMKGTAVSSESKDIARNAKEIILGSKILDKVMKVAGWAGVGTAPNQIESIVEEIKKKTVIKKVGDTLIRIEFTDKNPKRAYLTTKSMAENFIDIGKVNKVEESRSAYDFIEKQAAEYLEKLTTVDKKIKDFLVENPDARPGTQEKVTNHIAELKRKYEETTLLLREEQIRRKSIQKQLSGEAAMTISQSKEGKYNKKITEMETQLENLLLTYTDTYPDVIRLRRQIKDVKQNLADEISQRNKAIKDAEKSGKSYFDSSIATNPIYQQLRANLSESETNIATYETRNVEMKSMLDAEYDRMRRIQDGDAMMQALTRDYQVNEEIYQDLLKRRENARVSRSLDTEQKGSTFNILEPAKLPLNPSGLRFLHFIVLGMVAGLMMPLGIVFMLTQIDGKIRSARYITEKLGVVVLSEVPHYWKNDERSRFSRGNLYLGLAVLSVVLIYVATAIVKFMGII